MLSGIMFPADMLPKSLETLAVILPATWGFKLMTSEIFDVRLLIPLAVIMIVSIYFSGYKLAKIGLK